MKSTFRTKKTLQRLLSKCKCQRAVEHTQVGRKDLKLDAFRQFGWFGHRWVERRKERSPPHRRVE